MYIRVKIIIFILTIVGRFIVRVERLLAILLIFLVFTIIIISSRRLPFSRFILFIKSSYINIVIFFFISSYSIILAESSGYIINTRFLFLFSTLN